MIIIFSEVAFAWIEEKRKEVKKSTYYAYLTIIKIHVLPFFCDCKIIDKTKFADFIDSIKSKPISNKTKKDIIIVFRMILKYMVKKQLINSLPSFDNVILKEKRTKVDVMSNGEFKKLFNYVMNNFSFVNLGIAITMTTGLRIGEICALKWDDILLNENEISINKTIQRIYDSNNGLTELVVSEPKTVESKRLIPISNALKKILVPLLKIVKKECYIVSNNLRPIEPRTYRELFKKTLIRLDIKPLKFHCLRHTFATRCVATNSDYKTISCILGHSSIATTMNLYVHPNSEQKKKCIEKMIRDMI